MSRLHRGNKHECPKCYESFHQFIDYVPGKPAKPRRLFGLLPARPAVPEGFRHHCAICGYRWWRASEVG